MNKKKRFRVGQGVQITKGDYKGAYGQIIAPAPVWGGREAPYAVWLYSGVSGNLYGVHGDKMTSALATCPKIPVYRLARL